MLYARFLKRLAPCQGAVFGCLYLMMWVACAGCTKIDLQRGLRGSTAGAGDSVEDLRDASLADGGGLVEGTVDAGDDNGLDNDAVPDDDVGVDAAPGAVGDDDSENAANDAGMPPDSEGAADDTSAGDAGTLGPRLLGSQPLKGEMNVPVGTGLRLEFDRPIVAASGAIILRDGLSDDVVEAVAVTDVTISGAVLSVSWASSLRYGASYYVVVEAGALEDEAGQIFGGLRDAQALPFTTEAAAAPRLVASVPADGETGVLVEQDAILTFDQMVIAGSSGNFSVFDAETDASLASFSITSGRVTFAGQTLTVNLLGVLDTGRSYYVTLDPTAVLGDQGAFFAGLQGPTALRFSTEQPRPLILVDSRPAPGAVGVDPDANLQLTFDQPVSLGTGSVRVKRASDDELVEAVDVMGAGVSVFDTSVTVDLAGSLPPGETFYVTVDTTALSSTTGGALVGLASPTDLAFTTGDMTVTPVTLVQQTPAPSATGVPIGTELVLVFSEPIVAGGGTISVVDSFGTATHAVQVPSTNAAISEDTLTLTLPNPLKGNEEYFVLVPAGVVESLDGASFAGISDPAAWTFSTEDVFSLVAASPAFGATEVEPGTDLTLTFSSAVAKGSGQIQIVSAVDGVIEEFAVADGRVQVNGAVATIDPNNILAPGETFSVYVEAGAFEGADQAVSFGGFTASDGWAFDTAAPSPGGVSDGLMLWVDADYAPGLKLAAGAVRLWADRSGRYHNLTQGTAGARPALAAAAMNSRDVLTFDGTNDRLVASAGLALTSFEGFTVWQSPIAASTTVQRNLLVNGQNFEVAHGHHDGAQHSVLTCIGTTCNGNWYSARFTPAPKTGTATLWNFGYSAATTSLFASAQGGAAVNETGPNGPPVQPSTPLSVGGAAVCSSGCPYLGDIAEVLIYSRVLTDGEREDVTDYLQTKWATEQPQCGAGEEAGPNGSCYFLVTSNQSWSAARALCQGRGEGWDLVAVQSEQEHDFVITLPAADVWIGATDQTTADSWRWVTDSTEFWTGVGSTGSAVGGAFTAWRSGEPSAGPTEACARYDMVAGGLWADGGCEDSYGALCEGPSQ